MAKMIVFWNQRVRHNRPSLIVLCYQDMIELNLGFKKGTYANHWLKQSNDSKFQYVKYAFYRWPPAEHYSNHSLTPI